MTRPSPAPIVRDVQELRSILLGLPWVRREDEKQDISETSPGYTPGLSKKVMSHD